MIPLFLSCSIGGRLFKNRLRNCLIILVLTTFVFDITFKGGGGPSGNGNGGCDPISKILLSIL